MPRIKRESRVSSQQFIGMLGGVFGHEVLPLLVVTTHRKDMVLVRR
jgi:hypothetical protein